MNKESNGNSSCCQLNQTLQETYYEQIMGKRGYVLGYYTTYYYLLKDLKKAQKLCEKCNNFSQKVFDLYLEMKNKHSNF